MCKLQTQGLNVLLPYAWTISQYSELRLFDHVSGFVSVFRVLVHAMSGSPNDGFLLNTLKTLFRLCRVLLDL